MLVTPSINLLPVLNILVKNIKSWVTPEIIGYSEHINLYENSENEACDNPDLCEHRFCSMKKITPQNVTDKFTIFQIENLENKRF